jgi:mRNA-degrading endonuclease toxin of MazEF toxin-antitoxin module
MKDFEGWFKVKKRLDNSMTAPPNVKEGEVRWSALGENVGTEINGKSVVFSRPTLIIKIINRNSFLIAPLTTSASTSKLRIPIKIRSKNSPKVSYICLNQIRVIDHRRLYSKIQDIDPKDLTSIMEYLVRLLMN